MLILARKSGQKILIGDDIEISILEIRGRQVRVGIKAPKGLSVYREEVLQKILEENINAASSTTDIEDSELPFRINA